MNEILNRLVIYINDQMRTGKQRLEIEEKAREIAFLQGRISGYRKLLGLMKEHFELSFDFIEDHGEAHQDAQEFDDDTLRGLIISINGITLNPRWHYLIDAVNIEIAGSKEFLLYECEGARDLYFRQAEYQALTCYSTVFREIQNEYEERKGELFHNVTATVDELKAARKEQEAV